MNVTKHPRLHKAILDNGLAVTLCDGGHLSQAYCAVFFGVGSRHEAPNVNGITHVLEHMLFRGSASFSDSTALNRAAEDIGGFLEGATYRDHLTFATSCHPSLTATALDILGELVQTPRFQGLDIEKSILREEILETLDQRGRMIDLDNVAHETLFGESGLGLPIEGTLANLNRFDRAALHHHRASHLVARNAVVAVAGPIEPRRALRDVARAFGALPPGEVLATAVPPTPARGPLLKYVRDTMSQVDLRLSFPSVPTHHPDFPATSMLARVLGDGLSARLPAELVDRRGLAYSMHASLTTYADVGLFDFEASVAPDRAAEIVDALLSFAARAEHFRYGDDELQRACRRYRYGMEFMRDAPVELAHYYGRATLFGIETVLDALPRRLANVSAADVRRAARATFRRGGLSLTAVGELARGEWQRVKKVVARY